MHRCNRIGIVGLLVVWVAVSLAGTIHAGSFDMGRKSLKGLAGVQVGVKQPTQKTLDAGLSRDMVRQDVESRLKDGQVKILTARECLFSAPGSPTLGVEVAVSQLNGATEALSRYCYTIDLRLSQGVILSRDEKIVLHADTWRTDDFGQVNTLEDLRIRIKEKADEFVRSYRAANSDEPASGMEKMPEPRPAESETSVENKQ